MGVTKTVRSSNRLTSSTTSGPRGGTGPVGPTGPAGPAGPAGPGTFLMPMVPGTWKTQQVASASASTISAGTTNQLRLLAYWTPQAFSIDRIGLNVVTGVASSNARIIIYGSDAYGVPTNKLHETANISTATNSSFPDDTLDFEFESNTLYWLGVHTSANPTLRGTVVASQLPLGLLSDTGTTDVGVLLSTPAFGSAPDPYVYAPTQGFNGTAFMVRMRVAA